MNIEDAKTLRNAMDDKIISAILDFEERTKMKVIAIKMYFGGKDSDGETVRRIETTVVMR